MPKVSVVMGVYNGEKYLSEAIESILNQTFTDFEFIICDDGSSDRSVQIIENYANQDNRIVFLKNNVNRGLAATLNRCIEISKGEYIARMDCDDLSLRDRFEKQVRYLDRHKEIAIVGGAVYLFDEKGKYGLRRSKSKFNKVEVFKNSFFIHPTVMMRKSMLLSVNGYTVSKYTYRTEDYDLWCKFCYFGFQGANIDEVLLYYREDRDAYLKKKFRYRIDEMYLRIEWYKKLEIPKYYLPYIIKPIVAGLIPKRIMRIYHRKKYSNKVGSIPNIVLDNM